jgi:hypothetical protein
VSGMSVGGIIIMCVVIVLALLVLIGLVLYAVRHPHWRHPKIDVYEKPGDVRGGVHVGDPGSVAPRRDAPANPPGHDVPPGSLTSPAAAARRRSPGRRARRPPTMKPDGVGPPPEGSCSA